MIDKLKKALGKLVKSKITISFTSGLLLASTLAPLYLFPFGFLSLCTLIYLIDKSKSVKQSFFLGLIYGFGFFLAGNYWITISLFTDLESFWYLVPFSITLIPLFLGTYIALACLLYKLTITQLKFHRTYLKVIVFAISWLLLEVLRSKLFTGFPWNLIGYSWLFNINAAQIANIFGIYGLSLLSTLIFLSPIFLINLEGPKLKLISLAKIRKMDKALLAIILIIPVAAIIYGKIHILSNPIDLDKTDKIRVIQGNIPQDLKWEEEKKQLNLIKYLHLSTQSSLENIRAVIWPETAIPFALQSNEYKALQTLKIAIPENGVLIAGAIRVKVLGENNYKIWNSLFTFNQNGQLAEYDKRHLVPFGEYMPLTEHLPFISKITEGTTNFSSGELIKTIVTKHFSFSPLICYEVIFSDKVVNQYIRPDYLINITNDAWFGSSSGPYQHLDMAKMRSIEYGLPVIRAANTGISALIDPLGRIVDSISLNQEGVIDVPMIDSLEPTFYSKYRHGALLILTSLLISLLIVQRRSYTKVHL